MAFSVQAPAFTTKAIRENGLPGAMVEPFMNSLGPLYVPVEASHSQYWPKEAGSERLPEAREGLMCTD